MPTFAGKRGDETWCPYDYPVTPTQKQSLEALEYMMSGLPKSIDGVNPEGYFCSQTPNTGMVILGLNHKSVTVHRNGRVTSNEVFTYADVPNPKLERVA